MSQKIETTEFTTAKEIVGWMGALQAQDFAMAKWAVGVRLLNPTDTKIQAALNTGEIIRIHLMRPTWHFVSADDVYWLLDLSAGKIKAAMKSRDRELELSEAIFTRCNKIIESELSGGAHLTREELARAFHNVNINTDNNRLSHILVRAEVEGIVCSGQIKGNKQTYALLSERVPYRKILSKEESLAELAKRYFTSHGPATLQDFVWWSGLSVTEARQGLDAVKAGFIFEAVDSAIYWFKDSFSRSYVESNSVYLLPAFDEFLISYRDRGASLSQVHHKNAVSDNGIFRPVIVVNGQVTGLWNRTFIKDKVVIRTTPFLSGDKITNELFLKAARHFGSFIDKEVRLNDESD
ncbi:MAG TPA: winged helix DNA-binding domain-containing protein [Prolixibacteraceae bacterium]